MPSPTAPQAIQGNSPIIHIQGVQLQGDVVGGNLPFHLTVNLAMTTLEMAQVLRSPMGRHPPGSRCFPWTCRRGCSPTAWCPHCEARRGLLLSPLARSHGRICGPEALAWACSVYTNDNLWSWQCSWLPLANGSHPTWVYNCLIDLLSALLTPDVGVQAHYVAPDDDH